MDKPLVEVETVVDANAEAVWDALTARKSAMFMGADVETDWGPGSPISFTGEFNGNAFKDHGEIRDIEDRRRLTFTHFSPTSGKPDVPDSYNLVDVRLEPQGERTLVKLSQTPMGGDRPDQKTVAAFRRNWEVMVDGLKTAAEERSLAQG
ncbi:MAG: SRPBCC domain-containing protein [Sphingomicrobium sp.]